MDVIEFMILILQICPIVCGYEFVCPDRSHRKIYSKAFCGTPVNYACLKDVIENRYRQICFRSRPVGLGYKYVFRPNFDREVCDPSRYQPLIFQRKYHTDCVFLKSKCSEKGQIVDMIGFASTDVRCNCDKANGYIFVTKPKHSHYCIPSEEDCTCYRVNISIPEDIDIEEKDVNITVTSSDELIHDIKLDNKMYSIKDYEKYSRCAAITVVIVFVLGSIFRMWRHRQNRSILEKSTTPEEDIKKLIVIYDGVEDMVKCDDYDKDLQRELSIQCPNYMNVLESAKQDLLRNDCCIVVAGETNAGKSTLINTLVGSVGKSPLLESAILAAITRIRNSDELCIKAYTKDKVLIKEEQFDNLEALISAIQNFAVMEEMSADMKKDLHFLDVYLPVPGLKGSIIIVNTPGVSENKTLDEMLIHFLQHAVAFVFVINYTNEGGINDDILDAILNAIPEIHHEMPCCGIKDVLFLTNQCENIERHATSQNSPDSDSLGTVEWAWKRVKMNITDKWRRIPPENIFQISLREVQEGTSSKYTEEYKRFEEKLNKTIAINKNKRVQFYFEFIQRFHKKAIMGTLARLTLLYRSKEEHMKIMIENQEKSYQLKENCRKRRRQMQQCKKDFVEELSQKLNNYLHSAAGQHEILNSPGELEIGIGPLTNVNEEVYRRLKNGINRWCEKDETQALLGEADKVIKDQLGFIESQIMSIEIDLLGLNAVMAVEISYVLLDLGFPIDLIEFPLSVVSAIVDAVALVGFSFGLLGTSDIYIQGRVIRIFKDIVDQISPKKLKHGFDNSIGKEFDKVISDIFDDAMPKKIDSFITISRKLQDEYNVIKAKKNSIKRMKSRIEDMRKKIEEFKK